MYSSALVLAQYALIFIMVLFGFRGVATFPAAAVFFAGLAFGVWALAHNRLGNFNIRPDIKHGCEMVEGGPYRLVRHPMYTSVLGMMLGVLTGTPTWPELFLFALLITVLAVKARREERLWCDHHPRYADYRARTRMFIPFIL